MEAVAARAATVVEVDLDPPKTYLWLASPDGGLFAWYSTEPAHEQIVAYEAEARAAVGVEGPLRAPPLLAYGPLWRLERALHSEPVTGPETIARVVEAALELSRRTLPPPPAGVGRERRLAAYARRLRVVRSPLPSADLVRAKRVVDESALPVVTSHGEFTRRHLLVEDGVPWLVDWENAGQRPLGFDLMALWADLEDAGDRELLFEQSVEALGAQAADGLRKLGYALLVRLIGSCVAEPLPMNRDPQRAQVLLERLPAARRDALGR